MSPSFTCLILWMNKQAEYITNNHKVKSVNWIMNNFILVPGVKQTNKQK